MEDDLPGRRIKQRYTIRLMLMALPELQSRTLRNEITQMLRVTVSLTGTPKELAVVVDHAVAHADFLLAVIVYITDHQIVVALTVSSTIFFVVGIENPADGELFVHHIDRRDRHACIVPTVVNGRRMHAVKIRNAAVETIHTVAVLVAPVRHIAAWNGEIDGVERRTGLPVKERHVLCTVEDVATAVAVVLGAVADDLSGAVLGAVGGLGDELRLAVKVEIRHAHLCVMLSGADVFAKIHTPERLPGQRHTVNVDIARVAGF